MIQLTSDQQTALDRFIEFLFSDDQQLLINGYSGTGKTTLVSHLLAKIPETLATIQSLTGVSREAFQVTVVATTNTAVSEIRTKLPHNILDSISTCTIDSFLALAGVKNWQTGGLDMVPSTSKPRPTITRDIIFIDESSMLETWKYDYLIDSIKSHQAKIIFIQDPAQILPVCTEAIRPLGPFDNWKDSKVVWLKEIVRQTLNGSNELHPIAKLGLAFREAVMTGTLPDLSQYLCNEIQLLSREEMDAKILDHTNQGKFTTGSSVYLAYNNSSVSRENSRIRSYITSSPTLGSTDRLVVNGMYKITTPKGVVTLTNQQKLNHIEYLDTFLVEILPDYEVQVEQYRDTYLGADFLYVPYELKQQILKYLWNNKHKKEYFKVKETFVDVRPSFASTVHKAQGSTCDTAFIDLSNISNIVGVESMESFYRLMYVAVTRASSQLYIVE